jgi:hypothetical protein
MPWARIDDRANSDAKLLALSDSAYRLWVGALIFCQANLTDGFIPAHAIETFGVRAKNKAPLVRELTASVLGKRPLWQEVEGGWQFNDFLDWNDSREVVLAQRAKGKSRVDRFRAKLNGHSNAGRNATCNALQTPNELRSFAASTTTTKDQNQEPRVSRPTFPQAVRNRQQPETTIADIRSHLRAACHALLDGGDPEYHDDNPHQLGNLFEELKTIAARSLRCSDYDSEAIRKIVDAVLGERARRTA